MDTTCIPLLRKVMEYVTAHPEEHDQHYWGVKRVEAPPCGTTHCIGGWALVLSGADLIWKYGQVLDVIIDGDMAPPFVAARKVLGLTLAEAIRLFYAKDIDAIWRVVEDITDGALRRGEVAGN